MDREGSADVFLFEGFRLDRRGGVLYQLDREDVGTPVPLGSRAFNLLSLLIERRGQLVSKDAIMESVWPGRVVEEANLNVQISKLRHILDQNREHGSCIQTIPGRGYCFVGVVGQAEAPAAIPPMAGQPRKSRSAQSAVNRRAALREHEQRCRAGIFLGRDCRGHHHGDVAVSLALRYRAKLLLYLQGAYGRCEAARSRAGCPLCARRRAAQSRQSDPCYRPARRNGHWQPPLGRALRP
jgi:DNA-binding winged helix-turn-helix (wHTH) protein